MLNAVVLEHTTFSDGSAKILGAFGYEGALVKLMNKSSLYHFRLLSCGSSPNGRVGIACVPLGAICAPVAV